MPAQPLYRVRIQAILLAPGFQPAQIVPHAQELNQLYAMARIEFSFNPNTDVEDQVGSDLSKDTTGEKLTAHAYRYSGKLVIYFGTALGHLSGEGPYVHIYVGGAIEPGKLAHEVGHYFHLHHTFVENLKIETSELPKIAEIIRQGVESHPEGKNALAKIQAALASGAVVPDSGPTNTGEVVPGRTFLDIVDDIGSALLDHAMSGDSADKGVKFPVADTPASLHELPSGFSPADVCVPEKMIFPIPVTFTNGYKHIYTFKPDLANVMSYGHGCTNYDRYFSEGQARVMRGALEKGSRNHLLGPALRWSGWSEVQGNGKTNAPLAAAALAGRLYVFAKGPTGLILHNSALDGQPFGGWAEVQGGGQTDAAPAVTAYGNRLHVFVKGPTGLIFRNSALAEKPFVGWTEVQGKGKTDAAPATAVFGNRLHVFVKGPTGLLFRNSSADGNTFGNWTEVEGKGQTDAAPAAAPFNNRLYAFVKGPTGLLFHNSSADGNTFGDWAEVQGSNITNRITDAPVAVVAFADRLFAFAKGRNNRVYYNTAKAGEPFIGWNEVPGGGITDAAPAAVVLNNRLYLFVKGPTGLIFYCSAESM